MTTARHCQACGASNLADAEYCAACGVAIEVGGAERPWLAALADTETNEAPVATAAGDTSGDTAAPAAVPDAATDDHVETARSEPTVEAAAPTPPPTSAAATSIGATAPAAGPPPVVVYPPPAPRDRPWLAPTIAVFVVIALAAVLVAVLADRRSDSQQPDATVSTPAVTVEPTVGSTTEPTPATTATPDTTAPVTSTPGTDPPTTDPIDAAAELASLAATDRDQVLSLQGRWVPQLSAKRDGTEWEGVTYDLAAILDLHRELSDRVGGTLLVEGSTLAFLIDGERMAGWWITVAEQDFDDAEGALAWCADAGFDRANCAARFLTDDDTATGTLRLQSA